MHVLALLVSVLWKHCIFLPGSMNVLMEKLRDQASWNMWLVRRERSPIFCLAILNRWVHTELGNVAGNG